MISLSINDYVSFDIKVWLILIAELNLMMKRPVVT